jgi:hypothetical protein
VRRRTRGFVGSHAEYDDSLLADDDFRMIYEDVMDGLCFT